MTGKLAGKVAVVTGGSAGIGLGIAEHFAAEGARVFITGRHQSELDKAVTAIGGNAAAIQGDSANLADLDRIYTTVKAQAGHIDVLAANAGVYEFAALGEITEEHFDRTFNTNVRGLSPGYTATPGLSHFMTDEQKAEAIASVPLGRIGTPDDLGKAAVFLASDDSGSRGAKTTGLTMSGCPSTISSKTVIFPRSCPPPRRSPPAPTGSASPPACC